MPLSPITKGNLFIWLPILVFVFSAILLLVLRNLANENGVGGDLLRFFLILLLLMSFVGMIVGIPTGVRVKKRGGLGGI